MTTCTDCNIDEYTVENGIIRSPGKFEGEPIHAVHYYHMMLDGFGDYCEADDCNGQTFEIDADDAAMFPDLADCVGGFIHISVSDDGFVYCEIVSAGELSDHVGTPTEDE